MARTCALEGVVSMRVLVTGATGFVGQWVVEALVASGRETLILARENYADQKPLPPRLLTLRTQLDVVYADLRNFTSTARAIKQAEPDVVIHLAAAGVTDPFLGINTAIRHNVNGTINLLRACFEKHFTTRKVIIGRTPGEDTAMNVYAASKAAGWQFCRMFAQTQGWPIVGAMIYQAYGFGQPERTLIPSAFEAALAGNDFPMTDGKQVRDWIHIRDVTAGLLAMLDTPMKPATTLDIGTGQLTSVADVVERIYAVVGGKGEPLIGRLPSRPGESPIQVADTKTTQALLNWQAEITLGDGLRELMGIISNQ